MVATGVGGGARLIWALEPAGRAGLSCAPSFIRGDCYGTTHWRPDAAGGGLRRHRLLHPGNEPSYEDTPRRAGQTGQNAGGVSSKAPGSACCWPARPTRSSAPPSRSPGGGRVFLFLETDDWGDYERMQAYGVHFGEQPRPGTLRHRGGVRGTSVVSLGLLQLAAAN